jgi:hypothetical protein
MVFEVSHDGNWLILDESSVDSPLDKRQLEISLNRRIAKFMFHPLYKKKRGDGKPIWDGYISFLYKDKFIPIGLWNEVLCIGKKYDIKIEIKGLENVVNYQLDFDEFSKFCTEFFADHPKYKPRDYQIEAAFNIIKFKVSSYELATSSGKTMVIFMVIAWLAHNKQLNKFFLVVPNVTLVLQGVEDFQEYGAHKLGIKYQLVYGESETMRPDANVYIGTYQSLVKKDDDFFDGATALCIDECLHPDSMIRMNDGSLKKIAEVLVGDLVETVNEETKNKEYKEVEFVYKNLNKGEQMFELTMDDGRILSLTGNHKVKLINHSWKRVDELTETDDILCIDLDI